MDENGPDVVPPDAAAEAAAAAEREAAERAERERDELAEREREAREQAEREREAREQAERENDAAVEREVRRLTRRGFVVAAGAVATGYAGWKWLMTRPREGQAPWPLRRTLEANERLSEAYFSPARLSPSFRADQITRPARVNGHIGLTPQADSTGRWRLSIQGLAGGGNASLSMDDIRSLPRREMTTEFRCIEGWSTVVHWTGARLSDLMERFPPPSRTGGRGDLSRSESLVRYVAMETPGRQYYVGLDMASALHPQTLLAWEINGEPLDWHHGAPLRLAIPVKYGIKNIKRIATIRYSDIRPPDFWGDRGYDWYAGH